MSNIEEWKNKQGRMPTEVYSLVLAHYIDTGSDRIRVGEPLCINMVYERDTPPAVCINDMMEKMRRELLKMAGGPEWMI